MIGLAVLSATHWLRDNLSDPGPAIAFVLGVMPNLAAAFAMPLILSSFAPQVLNLRQSTRARAVYGLLILFTTLGLLGWEVVQSKSAAFVFDVYDIVATLIGSLLALFAFNVHMKVSAAHAYKSAGRGEA